MHCPPEAAQRLAEDERIADESRVFYLLGFRASTEGKGDEWRKLEVRVRNPDLKVRARAGYLFGG